MENLVEEVVSSVETAQILLDKIPNNVIPEDTRVRLMAELESIFDELEEYNLP